MNKVDVNNHKYDRTLINLVHATRPARLRKRHDSV